MKNSKRFIVGRVNDFSKGKGWFFGNFIDNELLKSDLVEVAWQDISGKQPEPDDKHIHTDSVEINIIINGSVSITINGEEYTVKEKEFYVIWPETIVENIKAEDQTRLIVVRAPSINDKIKLK